MARVGPGPNRAQEELLKDTGRRGAIVIERTRKVFRLRGNSCWLETFSSPSSQRTV